jgi:transposase InsO family protein
VLIESHSNKVFIDSFVSNIKDKKHKIKVRNVSENDIMLKHGYHVASAFDVSIATLEDNNENLKSNLVDISGASYKVKTQINEVLKQYDDIFVTDLKELNTPCEGVPHRLFLRDDIPVKEKTRPIPKKDFEDAKQYILDLLTANIIRRSFSAYNSPTLWLRKKDNSLRLLIDLRKLNSKTVRDQYPMKRIEHQFWKLSDSRVYSCLDLKSGYFQQRIADEDTFKFAFNVPDVGHFEMLRTPQGATNSPASFQRLMDEVLEGLDFCTSFIDDIIIFSRTEEEHIEHVKQVFDRLRKWKLKVAPEKTIMFKNEVKYLGHIIGNGCIKSDPEKIQAVLDFKVPNTVHQLRQWLGKASYFRSYIKNFAHITSCLYDLLKGNQSKHAPLRTWSVEHSKAFDMLKDKFAKSIEDGGILVLPNQSKQLILQVDSSSTGFGAILMQEHNGKRMPIAYASKKLSSSQTNLEIYKLEFMALHWAVVDKFKDYLYSMPTSLPTIIETDNTPLLYLQTSLKLDATTLRWVHDLSQYNFVLRRVSTDKNIADPLSRMFEGEKIEDDGIDRNAVHDLLSRIQHNTSETFALEQNVMKVNVLEDLYGDLDPKDITVKLSNDDWKRLQRNDTSINKIITILQCGRNISNYDIRSERDYVTRTLMRQFHKLRLVDGLLTRKVWENTFQIVVPREQTSLIYQLYHKDVGHTSTERTLEAISRFWYWPGMTKYIKAKVNACTVCLRNRPQGEVAQLKHLTATRPLEIISIDYVKLDQAKGKKEYALTMIDVYTKFSLVIPMLNRSAKHLVKTIEKEFINKYGVFERCHSDNGAEIVSQSMQILFETYGIEHTTCSIYSPTGNGLCEVMNKQVISLLRKLSDECKSNWPDHVGKVIHAYNCSKHTTTGYAPYTLFFGRNPLLHADLILGRNSDNDNSSSDYMEYLRKLKDRMTIAKKIVSDKVKQVQKRGENKRLKQIRKISSEKLYVGDRVLIRNFTPSGKLDNRWKSDIYMIAHIPYHDKPVYVVKHDDVTKVMNRRHLLKIPDDDDDNELKRLRKIQMDDDEYFEKENEDEIVRELLDNNDENDNTNETNDSMNDQYQTADENSDSDCEDKLPERPTRIRRKPDRYGNNIYQ